MRSPKGFTLVELMVTVAILAILASIAAPSFSRLLSDQRLSGAANALLADINYTRSEALRRGVNVSACPSSSAADANPSCSSGNDWAIGWIVFVDSDGNGSRNTVAGNSETLLRASTAVTGVSSALSTSGGNTVTFVRFNGRGLSPGAQQNIALTNNNADFDRTLCITASGRPRVSKGSSCP